MNHKERKQQLEIEIRKLIEAYTKETGFSVTAIRPEYVEVTTQSIAGFSEKNTYLAHVWVTAEV